MKEDHVTGLQLPSKETQRNMLKPKKIDRTKKDVASSYDVRY